MKRVVLPVVAYLAVAVSLAATFLDLPLLAWVGVGVACALTIGAAVAVALLLTRLRAGTPARR